MGFQSSITLSSEMLSQCSAEDGSGLVVNKPTGLAKLQIGPIFVADE